MAEALALQVAQRAAQLRRAAGAPTCGPNLRSARPWLRSWQSVRRQIEHDRDRQARRARARARPAACARPAARSSRRSPSAVRRPAACAAMKCSTSKASLVAVWSFSSSETSPRQKSDEMTSVGRKCLRANVDLPEPDAPISTTSESFGNRDLHRVNTAICVGAPSVAIDLRRSARSAPRSRGARRRALGPGANSARVHSKRWSRWRNLPAGSASNCTLYSAFGVVTTTVAGLRELEHDALERGEARRIEVLDHLDRARRVEAGEAARRDRSASPGTARSARAGVSGIRSRLQAVARDLERARRDVDADDLRRTLLRAQESRQQPALAAAEIDHRARARTLRAPRAPRRGAAR